MVAAEPSFSLAIEEEYLLADADSRDVVSDPRRGIVDKGRAIAGDELVDAELLRADQGRAWRPGRHCAGLSTG